MTAVCIDVNMIMFNVYITVLVCFDVYARIATLIMNSSYSDYWDLVPLSHTKPTLITETCHLCV